MIVRTSPSCRMLRATNTQSILHLLLPIAVGTCLGFLAASFLPFIDSRPSPEQAPPIDPSYVRPQAPSCGPAPRLHERPPLSYPGCLVVRNATATTISFQLSPPPPSTNPPNYTLQLTQPSCSAQSAIASVSLVHNRSNPFHFSVSNLHADTDYIAELRERVYPNRPPMLVCRQSVSTLPSSGNLVLNPGFETVADPPYLATRFRRADDAAARHWTPFYNGAAHRVCGVVPLPGGEYLQPRTGRCCLRLGNAAGIWPAGDHAVFHGVHQAVHVQGEEDSFVVLAWYRVEKGLEGWRKKDAESAMDRLAMVVSWRDEDGNDDDGFVVPLQEKGKAAEQWTHICARVQAAKEKRLAMIHVYFHFHDYEGGHVFVDDVAVRSSKGFDPGLLETCYHDPNVQTAESTSALKKPYLAEEEKDFVGKVPIHIRAEVRPSGNQLTLAVPMTSDRVLRLEAMSRLYGGGPMVAAVLVRDEEDAAIFRAVWMRKAWLRHHVDITFVRRIETPQKRLLEINALRNIAVRAVQTTFVMMADVDMTPATNSFACVRDGNATWLGELLPLGEKRMLTVPVFISDVQHRPATDKVELQNLLRHQAGTSYCLNSQRSNKIKRWYRERDASETRFLTDYEPYGIVRRDQYPVYDERFSGYGFNKISWAYGSELGGWRIFVLPDAFLTHLNHVENDWVQSINVPHYLQTWRHFLAFAAEKARPYDAGATMCLRSRDAEGYAEHRI